MDKITKKFFKKEYNYSEILSPMLKVFDRVNSKYYISSTLFFRPENVLFMADGTIKLRLNDYHFFNEKHDSHPPFISHVFQKIDLIFSTTFLDQRSSDKIFIKK